MFQGITVVANKAILERIEGVVFSDADVFAGKPFCAYGKYINDGILENRSRLSNIPLCLKIILPGTTHSEEPFLAPSLRPAESVGPLARPCCAWEACRTKMVDGRGWRAVCLEQRLNEFKDVARMANEASGAATGLYNRG